MHNASMGSTIMSAQSRRTGRRFDVCNGVADGMCAVVQWRRFRRPGEIRAPIEAPSGAHELCRCFGGTGRERARRIDRMPVDRFEAFVQEFAWMRWGTQARPGARAVVIGGDPK